MDSETAAYLKVIIDAQAWLYAELMRSKTAQIGMPMTDDEFQIHEDAFKEETANLIETLIESERIDDE